MLGCDGDQQAPRMFQAGEIVELVLNGQRAQIIKVHDCRKRWVEDGYVCAYEVRAVANQIFTDTHLFSADGPLHGRPLALFTVREFELRKPR